MNLHGKPDRRYIHELEEEDKHQDMQVVRMYLQQGETVLDFSHVRSHRKGDVGIRVLEEGLDEHFQPKHMDTHTRRCS